MDLDSQFENILLEPEQEELLCRVVEASRSVPREERMEFFLSRTNAGDHLIHSGLKGNTKTFMGDVEILAQEALINLSYGSRGTPQFNVTPFGFKYYEYLKNKRGEPVEQVEKEVRSYMDAEDFQTRYPAAYQKWRDAEALLWNAELDRELTTIGHLCREAIQEFADALIKQYPPSAVDPDKARTVARVRGVLNQRAAGSEAQRAFLDVLVAYWGTVSDLVQRQEHGAQREQGQLTWEDARRVVFQTLLVMYEVDRALRK